MQQQYARALAISFLAWPILAQAPAPSAGAERVTSVEGITEYKLGNGLHILLFPDPTKQTVTVNATYLVGSRNEHYGETGMAHLLEHMVFKGTPNHRDIPKELSNHGARPNGTTSWDRTNYFETFAATDENLNWSLDLESDRMVNSFIAKKDLDSEMTVVRNEFESGENSPQRVTLERGLSAAYNWHNYGKSVIGSRADIEHVPIERLQAFYHNYYQPDNCVLTIAGKIDEAKTLQLVGQYFGKIPRPERTLMKTYTAEPVQDGERQVTVRRVGDTQLIYVFYHIPDAANPDMSALDLMADILRRQPSGRLYKALVETKKAASVGAGTLSLREPGVILFNATVRKESNLDDARETLLKTVEEFASNPPTDKEIEDARADLLKPYDLALADSGRIGLTLSNYIASGDWRLLFLERDRLKKVTGDDVVRVAKTYLKSSNRTLALFVPTDKPERTEVPPPTDISAVFKDYHGGAAIAQGEAFDPSPENIDKRTIRGSLGNGMKLVMLPKKTRGETVNVEIVLHLGDEHSLMNKELDGLVAGGLLMRGTTKHSRQQITDEFNRLKAQVSVFGSATGARASIETTRANLPEVLKLVAEILREPAFPENEFEQYKQQQLAGIESGRREPQTLARAALEEHLNPYPRGDMRHYLTSDEAIEDLKKTKLDGARAFYKDFYGASKGEFVAVGDFDAETTQKLASDLFGDWKSPKAHQRIPNPYKPVASINQSIKTPDKANAYIVFGENLDIGDEHPDYAAMVLGNYILGSGMNSRLFQRVRGKEGLSYGVSSSFTGRVKEESGSFRAMAIYAPQNVNKVETAMREVLAQVLKDGFTAEEVAAAKKGWLQSRTVSRSQDRELVGTLSSFTYDDRTMARAAELEHKVVALTPEQVVEALRRHLDLSRLSVVKAGDYDKAGVTP
ncbi:MAG TPA: pitrilysin family protein [Bryobacteraceae bacterium]|jgi:zinc protease